MKIHQKIKFWSLLGVNGKARGQEMSIFDVFGHLKIFENFGKLVNVKKIYGTPEIFVVANRAAHLLEISANIQKYTQIYKNVHKYTHKYTDIQIYKYT